MLPLACMRLVFVPVLLVGGAALGLSAACSTSHPSPIAQTNSSSSESPPVAEINRPANDPTSPEHRYVPGSATRKTSASGPDCIAADSNAPDAGAADVVVAVDAARGPHGGVSPVVVDRRLLGMNIADWCPGDYAFGAVPEFDAMLDALQPGVLRWPAGHRSQEYVWSRGGDGQSGNWTLTPEHVDAFIALAKRVHAKPLVAIDIKRGTVAAAADLVHYLNVEKGYGVEWLQLGNEPDLTDGIFESPEVFAQNLVAFADGIRAVDPNVRFVGPELLTGAHVNGIHGTTDWLTPILVRAQGRLDALSWHYYPLDTGQKSSSSSATLTVPHLFQETAWDWPPAGLAYVDDVMPALAAAQKAYAPNAQVWVTEFAEDPGPGAGAGISDTVAGALWAADALGRYAEYGPSAVLRWIFKGSAEHAYALLDGNNRPRPSYGTYWLYARHLGKRFVSVESSVLTDVAAHAALRDDGALTIILVNKTTSPKRVHLSIKGFCIGAERQITLEGDGSYGATEFRVGGQTLTPANVTAIADEPVTGGAAGMFDTELPAASVRVLAYHNP